MRKSVLMNVNMIIEKIYYYFLKKFQNSNNDSFKSYQKKFKFRLFFAINRTKLFIFHYFFASTTF